MKIEAKDFVLGFHQLVEGSDRFYVEKIEKREGQALIFRLSRKRTNGKSFFFFGESSQIEVEPITHEPIIHEWDVDELLSEIRTAKDSGAVRITLTASGLTAYPSREEKASDDEQSNRVKCSGSNGFVVIEPGSEEPKNRGWDY